jgi:SnoaL-like domain
MNNDRSADIEAIKALKARYFRLMDGKRWDEWADVLTEHCWVQYFPDDATRMTGRDRIVRSLTKGMADVISVHQGYMPEIELTGEHTARGVWAMSDYIVSPPGTRLGSFRGYGHYHETYERGADGRWRISTLMLTRLRVTPIDEVP